VLEKLEFYRSRFFWQSDQEKKKYRLVRWNLICQPKEQGGLGVTNLTIQNQCLMSKWLFKLCNEDGIWQCLISNKYLKNKTIGSVQMRAGDSHFWKGLMKIKDQFLQLGRFTVNNGMKTRFWEDRWIGKFTLHEKFPRLYNIARRKDITVAEVLSSNPLNISFRRALMGNNLRDWNRIVATVVDVNLNQQQDKFIWALAANGIFSVRSMYAFLINNGIRVSQGIWKAKLPMKIKVFMWYLKKGVILTKDNLAKRNWRGNTNCSFCGLQETVNHLFFKCAYARFLWTAVHMFFGIPRPLNIENFFNSWLKTGNNDFNRGLLVAASALCWSLWITRNEIVFDKCRPKSFLQVLFRGTHWLRQWAQLQRHESARLQLVDVCRLIESSSLELFASPGWSSALRISVF
jgi:hypothetical protein